MAQSYAHGAAGSVRWRTLEVLRCKIVFPLRGAYVGQEHRGKGVDQPDVRSAFWRNEDGSWICIDPVTLDHPNGRVQVAPGTTLQPGMPYMGIDLAAWLEEQTKRHSAPR